MRAFPNLHAQSARECARHLRALVVALLALASVAATEPEPTINRYSRSWTSEHGLRGNQVWAILQDPAGYLWLGTNEGLVRFDGVGFQVWRDFGGVPLPGGSVRALTLASDGSMWMGFGGDRQRQPGLQRAPDQLLE